MIVNDLASWFHSNIVDRKWLCPFIIIDVIEPWHVDAP